MNFNVALTASQRSTIFDMAMGQKGIDTVQNRLNSGYKVNSAQDDATTFFTASGLRTNADDYSKMKDKISLAVSTTTTAIDGLESIKKLVEQKQGILTSVRQTTDATTRANLLTTYNKLQGQINTLAADATFNGKNLVQSAVAANHLEVVFDPEAGSKLTISATRNDAAGLSLASLATWGASNTYLTTAENKVSAALSTLKVRVQTLGVNMATLETRDDWTQKHINTLKTGADSITLADVNEEAANLKALQMTQFFGMSNLGFTNQMQQGVLRLLG